jgi:hypothetical protein
VGINAPFIASGVLMIAAAGALMPMRLSGGIAKPTRAGAER